MYKPRDTSIKTYSPTNTEYSVVDEYISEGFEAMSPNILWWTFDHHSTDQFRDELDNLYGENSTGKKTQYNEPNLVYGFFEAQPIMPEISKLGGETIEEVMLFVNRIDFLDRNNADPKAGDVFRIKFQGRNDIPDRYIFYTVSAVEPTDLFHFKYLTWTIYAEKSNMTNIPEYIKNFQDLDETNYNQYKNF